MFSEEERGAVDLSTKNEFLASSVKRLRESAERVRELLHRELDLSAEEEDDKRALEELLEEELDAMLRDDETFDEIADGLMDEIEKRLDLLPAGAVTKDRQGWPLTWKGEWPVDERREFIRSVSRFSSNYAPWYGRLLTPLVNGVRVAGPFSPNWKDGGPPKLNSCFSTAKVWGTRAGRPPPYPWESADLSRRWTRWFSWTTPRSRCRRRRSRPCENL